MSGKSADRIDRAKSVPDDKRTREEGKKVSEVTLDACAFDISLRLLVLIWLVAGALGRAEFEGRGTEG